MESWTHGINETDAFKRSVVIQVIPGKSNPPIGSLARITGISKHPNTWDDLNIPVGFMG